MLQQEDVFIEKNPINFKVLTFKMVKNWYWVTLSILICLTLSYLYLRYTPPMFVTSAKILIKGDASSSPGEDALAKAFGGQMGTASSLEGEAEILKTRHLMEKVVRSLKSYITYEHKGKVRSVILYDSAPFRLSILSPIDSIKPVSLEVQQNGNMLSVSSDSFTKTVNFYQVFSVPGLGKVQIEKSKTPFNKEEVYVVNVNTINKSVGYLLSKLDVNIPIKQADIIGLNFSDHEPQYAEDVLNKLIESYIQENLQDKNKVADSTIAFIDNRLVYVSQELGNIEGNVQVFKQQNKIADIASQSSLLINSTGSNIESLSKVETQLNILNAVEEYLTSSETNQRLIPNGALLEDPAFATLVERYNLIVLEKEKSSISQTEGNPYMQNLNTQIAGARADMLSSLRGLKKSLLISKQNIESRSGILAGEVRKVPAVERKYLDLSRQQQIKQELYVYLLTKREETAISKTSNISNCKIIEPPISSGPVSPVRSNIMGYGFLLGLVIPMGIIFIHDRLNNKVNSVEQVKEYSPVAIIGEIGKNTLNNETIVVAQGTRTPISEQFRALRTNLVFFLKENQKTILLTSSMSGEGKSFIALNLATVLAISGKRVVVMEMDLRKPNLSNKLNLTNDFGFTNYVVSPELTANDIIKASGVHDNLFIISSGNIPPNPAEIILNSRLDLLMDEVKIKFDYVIIDAPPIGMVTDAQLLSKYSDLTLYVVRQGYTMLEQLDILHEIHVNKRINNTAILMNDVDNGNRYGYGYGYGIEQESKGFISRIFKSK